MKKYDFDKRTERAGTGALKYDALKERYGRSDLLPLWVADMDFETPDFITEALKERLEHPVFGYSVESSDFRPAVVDWLRELHGWETEEEWITYIPGIVKGIGMAINVFTRPGDRIIIQPPVYHPFRLVPEGNGRNVVFNPLKEDSEGGYTMDTDHLEQLASGGAKMLILSNPHNPSGIVWDKKTLMKVAEICHRNGVLVISDEIHSDMALFGNRHIPFASVSPEAAECSITFGAPSKTFNIAGIVSSYAVVPDKKIREKFYGWLTANEFNEAPVFSAVATEAAFRKGHQWRREMLRYVEDNIDFVTDYCKRRLPEIKPLRPQASFLIWLDCRGMGLDQQELVSFFVDEARLALNDGAMFGLGGEGFMRLNVGAPRSVVEEALKRISEAYERRKLQSIR